MLHLVKYRWQNKHGAWIGPEWMTVLHDNGHHQVKSYATIGKPSLQAIEVLDRVGIPEELRSGGHIRVMLANVVRYDKNAKNMTASEFVDAMRDQVETALETSAG
jgi:hypothetical protein